MLKCFWLHSIRRAINSPAATISSIKGYSRIKFHHPRRWPFRSVTWTIHSTVKCSGYRGVYPSRYRDAPDYVGDWAFPNIIGSARIGGAADSYGSWYDTYGAFIQDSATAEGPFVKISERSGTVARAAIFANKYAHTYGNSTTVQPTACQILIIIKIWQALFLISVPLNSEFTDDALNLICIWELLP